MKKGAVDVAVNSEALRDWSPGNERYILSRDGYGFNAYFDDKNRKLIVKDIACGRDRELDRLIVMMGELGERHEVNKITVFVRSSMAPYFFENGYRLEASIPRYYDDGQGMLIISKFLRSGSLQEAAKPAGILIELGSGMSSPEEEVLPDSCCVEMGNAEHISGWYDFYERVDDGSLMFLPEKAWAAAVRENKDIVAAACLITDGTKHGAELAILKSRGKAAEKCHYGPLIKALTDKASGAGLNCVYALVDSGDTDLSRALAERGFSYRGQLLADVVREREFTDRYVWSLNL